MRDADPTTYEARMRLLGLWREKAGRPDYEAALERLCGLTTSPPSLRTVRHWLDGQTVPKGEQMTVYQALVGLDDSAMLALLRESA